MTQGCLFESVVGVFPIDALWEVRFPQRVRRHDVEPSELARPVRECWVAHRVAEGDFAVHVAQKGFNSPLGEGE